ncbi:MAG: 50S ribosomal protein L11 methyltransferase [Ignavibacteria bacterium]
MRVHAPRTYTEVVITADAALIDHLVALLSQLGFEGFWEDGSTLRCYMHSRRWQEGMLEEVQRVATTVQRSHASPIPSIEVHSVDERNWNEEWEKTIQPIHLTPRIVVAPTWQPYQPSEGELLLTIDPKMSFGTGYHETTRLVLRLLERIITPGCTLLDVGTGTGILAIAAIKLGAARAVGVDNDHWSYENAWENVRLNHVEDRVTIVLGELSSLPQETFDVLAANIQRNVIEPMLPRLRGLLARDGKMILSGLLLEDEEPLTRAIHALEMHVVERLTENEWLALLCMNTPLASTLGAE